MYCFHPLNVVPQVCEVATRGVKGQKNLLHKGKNMKRPNMKACMDSGDASHTSSNGDESTYKIRSGAEDPNNSHYHNGSRRQATLPNVPLGPTTQYNTQQW